MIFNLKSKTRYQLRVFFSFFTTFFFGGGGGVKIPVLDFPLKKKKKKANQKDVSRFYLKKYEKN